MVLENTEQGILVRPASVFPFESYSEERLGEFEAENNTAIAEAFPVREGERTRSVRIFLDANLLFPAAQQGSPSQQLTELLAGPSCLPDHPSRGLGGG